MVSSAGRTSVAGKRPDGVRTWSLSVRIAVVAPDAHTRINPWHACRGRSENARTYSMTGERVGKVPCNTQGGVWTTIPREEGAKGRSKIRQLLRSRQVIQEGGKENSDRVRKAALPRTTCVVIQTKAAAEREKLREDTWSKANAGAGGRSCEVEIPEPNWFLSLFCLRTLARVVGDPHRRKCEPRKAKITGHAHLMCIHDLQLLKDLYGPDANV